MVKILCIQYYTVVEVILSTLQTKPSKLLTLEVTTSAWYHHATAVLNDTNCEEKMYYGFSYKSIKPTSFKSSNRDSCHDISCHAFVQVAAVTIYNLDGNKLSVAVFPSNCQANFKLTLQKSQKRKKRKCKLNPTSFRSLSYTWL